MGDEGDGGGELEMGAAVQGHEFLAVEKEAHGEDGAGRPGHAFLVVVGTEDFRVLEDGNVEAGRLFRLAVEPQAGTDFLHGALLKRAEMPGV